MGVVFKREYIWWNIRKDWMPLRKRQRIAQDAGGYINHPDPGHWGDYRKSKPQICHRKEFAANASPIPTKRTFGERYQKSEWNEMWRETWVFIKLLF